MKRFLSIEVVCYSLVFLILSALSVWRKSSVNGIPFILGFIINISGWVLLFGLFYWINPKHWYTNLLVILLYIAIIGLIVGLLQVII